MPTFFEFSVIKTAPAQVVPTIAPDQAVSSLAGHARFRGPSGKYPALRRPSRNRPVHSVPIETEAAIWRDIEKTAPTRIELGNLLRRFRSEQETA